MDGKYWLGIVGVFCISCSSLPAHVEGNGEENEGEGAPEAIADPLQLVLWGVDDVKWLLGHGGHGTLCFAEVFVRELIRNERFGIPPAGRVLIEDTWDCCLNRFVIARESFTQCIERLDAMTALIQAIRNMVNGEPDHVAEAQQNYLELCRRHHQNSVFRDREERGDIAPSSE